MVEGEGEGRGKEEGRGESIYIVGYTCGRCGCVYTFDGPFLIFPIWSLYFFNSRSSFEIFFSMDSARLSTLPIQSVRFGGGAFFLAPPNKRFMAELSTVLEK